MRTTITLEPDVAERVKRFAHQRRTSFKLALDELLRRGLAAQGTGGTRGRFVVKPVKAGFQPGVDLGRLNQLSDQLETDDFVAKTGR